MLIYNTVTAKTATVLWPRGQAVKTSPFHGGNTGSIPVGVIAVKGVYNLDERNKPCYNNEVLYMAT